MLNISVIIPVRNRQYYTRNILRQLEQQIAGLSDELKQGICVIVVDDGSTDDTREIIKKDFPQTYLIEGDGSLWWAGAIVKGMKHALRQFNSDYILWLNDDIIIAENFIENLIRICTSAHYQKTIVGGIVFDKTYSDWIVYSGLKDGQPIRNRDKFLSSPALEADVLCGNIVVIPRKIVNTIGFPDCVKLPHHGSDYEYIMRAKKAGFRAIVYGELQANTDYKIEDFIRYMPYWMQWYLQPNFCSKLKLIKELTNLKFNQNIWLIVNLHSKNINKKNIQKWNYLLCYFNKFIRFLIIEILPKKYVEPRIKDYLKANRLPQELNKKVLNNLRY